MSSDDKNFHKCMNILAEAGITPKVYSIEQDKLLKIKPNILSKINQVREIAEKLDCAVAIVGGFARDLILGEPSEDVDFMIFQGSIEDLTNEIANQLDGKVGKMSNQTLTTQVRFQDNIVFEFNSTRKERYEYPSRVPIVENATLVDDLNRRDFTINTLLMFEKKLIDVFDGLRDLKEGIIKTTRTPSTVFHEDYLRMFRAIRFACRLNFEISEETQMGIRDYVDNILNVPSERILNELKQSFEYNPLKAFRLMVGLKIFETMFPEIPNKNLNQDVFTIETLFEKIAKEIQFLMDSDIKEIYPFLSLIFKEVKLDVETEDFHQFVFESKLALEIEKILTKYKFSNKEKLLIHKYIQFSLDIQQFFNEPITKLKIREYIRETDPKTQIMIQIFQADQSTRISRKNVLEIEKKIAELSKNRGLIFFNTALNGNDIANYFNIKGHEIGKAKKLLTAAIMSEEINNTKEECIEYLKTNLKS